MLVGKLSRDPLAFRLAEIASRPLVGELGAEMVGEAIWGDFDAQEIFDNLAGDLQIEPVNVGFAAYYESLGRVDLMKNHPDEKSVFISGKDVRATLLKGQLVDPRIMRESTSEILATAMGSAT